MGLERDFQAQVIRELKDLFPEAVVLKNDPTYIQGFPDLLILFGTQWAALEVKRSAHSAVRPNQQYYVDTLNRMSYSSFIYPENKEAVFDELQQTFGFHGGSRVPWR